MVANPACGQLDKSKPIYYCSSPFTRLKSRTHQTGSAVPSGVGLFILRTQPETEINSTVLCTLIFENEARCRSMRPTLLYCRLPRAVPGMLGDAQKV